MTYSIVAIDRRTGDCGVAVQSRFLAVGAVVPWARADAGAVATQAFADYTIGPRALGLLLDGVAPDEIATRVVADDPLREQRQFGLVALDGRAASFTGSECFDHASSIVGDGYAAQGNILAGRAVVEGLVTGFAADPSLPLADRLIAALVAAEAAGGDKRGMESAALLVVRAGGGYGGNNDRYLDLRVDDHEAPIDELARVLRLHRLYFERPEPGDILPLDGAIRAELEAIVAACGYTPAGTPFEEALTALYGWENLEERWVDATHVDRVALAHLRETRGGLRMAGGR